MNFAIYIVAALSIGAIIYIYREICSERREYKEITNVTYTSLERKK